MQLLNRQLNYNIFKFKEFIGNINFKFFVKVVCFILAGTI